MSVGLSTLSQMQIAFFDSLNQFVTRYQQLLDGNSSTEIAEVVGGARIRYIFHGFHDWRVSSRRVSLETGRIGLCPRDSRGRFPLLFPLLTRRNLAGHRESAGRERRFIYARSVLHQPHEERNPHLLPVLVVSFRIRSNPARTARDWWRKSSSPTSSSSICPSSPPARSSNSDSSPCSRPSLPRFHVWFLRF